MSPHLVAWWRCLCVSVSLYPHMMAWRSVSSSPHMMAWWQGVSSHDGVSQIVPLCLPVSDYNGQENSKQNIDPYSGKTRWTGGAGENTNPMKAIRQQGRFNKCAPCGPILGLYWHVCWAGVAPLGWLALSTPRAVIREWPGRAFECVAVVRL